MNLILLFPIFFPIVMGLVLLLIKKPDDRRVLLGITGGTLVLTAAVMIYGSIALKGHLVVLFHLTDTLPVYFRPDGLGKLFAWLVTLIWLCVGFYSFSYMKGDESEKRFYGFFLMVYGVLMGLDFSGNLVTFYLFYEMMTLLSVPLVLHTRSREAVMAGLKYLFYSLCGAYFVLYGIYFLNKFGTTMAFTEGGVLNPKLAASQGSWLLVVAFLMLLGFGVKAGMFPLHSWLPVAHPVAPGPASAALSSIIVKSGVLGIIRIVYYIFGADFLRGTWVQTSWMILILITVFMGSMLAFREKVLKKRLAYSTVSQVSYILLGLAFMQETALTGSLLHVVFHGVVKCSLFLIAGAIIHKTGKTRVEELDGIGKKLPLTMVFFTLSSLALIGIPPASGFVSKWYLALGALQSGQSIFSWFGPVVLLVSALLTAGYLLPISMRGFFRGEDAKEGEKKKELSFLMLIPIGILSILSVLLGMFPGMLTGYIQELISRFL